MNPSLASVPHLVVPGVVVAAVGVRGHGRGQGGEQQQQEGHQQPGVGGGGGVSGVLASSRERGLLLHHYQHPE